MNQLIGANYSKIVDSFEGRFDRDDLPIKLYVREWLKLVLSSMNSKVKLSDVYDRIESQPRSLENLRIKSDQHAVMLYPLI